MRSLFASTARRPLPKCKSASPPPSRKQTRRMDHRLGLGSHALARKAVSYSPGSRLRSPNNPVFLVTFSGHRRVVNSAALKPPALLPKLPIPPAVKSNTIRPANPTACSRRLRHQFGRGKDSAASNDRRKKGIELVLADVAANGVTSIQDNSLVDALGKASAAMQATTPGTISSPIAN